MLDSTFERIDQRHIVGLNIDFDSYIHKPTGARHFHLGCDDTNNAFIVAFPTTPTDSTGVAHILEHTTLCGSRRYPVRDPFFMMLRRSLNTFMNAFTSGDSTAYPFATQNRKDFDNLLAVYLDAVFFPLLDPLDFAQEGWRLEFADEHERELVFKGVVYNEMKGAMSSPSSQLWEHLHRAVFPHAVYRHNSGGDPAYIPELNYAALKAFHEKHYHPTHAVFMTYGCFPVAEHQAKIESLALSRFAKSPENIRCDIQSHLSTPVQSEESYGVTDTSELKRGTHVVWGWLLGLAAEPMSLLEGHLLAEALLGNSASPLRHLLETTPLADAPSELCGLDDSAQQLVFCCGLEGTDREQVESLNREVLGLFETLAETGIDHEILVGIVDRMEMAQRDIGGGYPYGLQLMGRALPAALYDRDPAALIDIDNVVDEIRERIKDPGYIKMLIREGLLSNTHFACNVMYPDLDKLERDAAAEKLRLAEILARSDGHNRDAIRSAAAKLAARQDEPQDATLLPKVGLADVPRKLVQVGVKRRALADTFSYYGDVASNGLLHAQLVFDLPHLEDKQIANLPIFCEYLTELGAGDENYLQTQARRARIGDVSAYAHARTCVDDIRRLDGRLLVTVKGLQRKRDELVDNLLGVLACARFDELPRLLDLLAQSRVDVESSITDRGHSLAMQGAARGLSAGAQLDDLWEGPTNITHVQKLEQACRLDKSALRELADSLESIRSKIVVAPWRIVIAGEASVVANTHAYLRDNTALPVGGSSVTPFALTADGALINRAWITNTQVNFCAQAYSAVVEGHRDAAAFSVLAKFLTDGYLHPAIREKGGAYGGGAQFDAESATFRFYSYRDPRLTETLDDFRAAPAWLMKVNDAQRLEESILGVIRTLDTPRPPAAAAIRAFHDELDGRTLAFRQTFRDRVLDTTMDDVRRVADQYLANNAASTAVVSHAGHQSDFDRLDLEVQKL